MGMRDLTYLAAGPGRGKTVFMSQVIQDVLISNNNVCGFIVSFEMSKRTILDRLISRALRRDYSDVVTKWDEDCQARAEEQLDIFKMRLAIIDDSDVGKEFSAARLITEIVALKEFTGAEHCIVGIDYFQRIPYDASKFKNELAADDFRADELLAVRKALGTDPLIIISEVSKSDGFGGAKSEKLKGSGRIAFSADTIGFLNCLTAAQLATNVEMVDRALPRPSFKFVSPELKPTRDQLEQAEDIERSLKEQRKEYQFLTLTKTRDGGTRGSIPLTFYIDQSRYVEGLA